MLFPSGLNSFRRSAGYHRKKGVCVQNSECIEMFEKYLVEDKKASANTLSSYLRDIRQLGDFLDAHGENGIVEASAEELSA